MCHYISSTEIPKFWKKKKDDANLNADEGLDLIHNIQKNESKQKDLIRRPTIANLSAYHKRTKGKGGEHIDLEKQFLEKFENIGKNRMVYQYNSNSNTIDTFMMTISAIYFSSSHYRSWKVQSHKRSQSEERHHPRSEDEAGLSEAEGKRHLRLRQDDHLSIRAGLQHPGQHSQRCMTMFS